MVSKILYKYTKSPQNNKVKSPKLYYYLPFQHCMFDLMKCCVFQFPSDPTERVNHFISLCNEYGNDGFVFLYTFFREPMVVACTPEAMAVIAKSNGKGRSYGTF